MPPVVCLIIRSAVALGLVAVALLASGIGVAAVAPCVLAVVTPWLAGIDIREHRLPNRLVVPAILAGILSCVGEWIVAGDPPIVPLVTGAGYPAFLLMLRVTGGMGMGDVKLGAALGLASWNVSIAVLSPVIAFLVGGLVAVALLAAGRRGHRIAFGPYLLGGYWVALALVAAAALGE